MVPVKHENSPRRGLGTALRKVKPRALGGGLWGKGGKGGAASQTSQNQMVARDLVRRGLSEAPQVCTEHPPPTPQRAAHSFAHKTNVPR